MTIEQFPPALPVRFYFGGYQLLPCSCGKHKWELVGSVRQWGWAEDVFACQHCGNRIYLVLPTGIEP